MSRRAGLDRDLVVETAAELVDAAGDEVTLGALARRLGVRTPSLYNHVEGQHGLRRELALLGLRELGATVLRAAAGKAADEALLAVSWAYLEFARARPGLYRMIQRAPDSEDRELAAAGAEVVGVLAAVMEPYGLLDDDAIHAIRGLRSLLHGFAALEAAGGFGIPLDIDESFERAVRVYISGLRSQAAGDCG